MNGNEIAQEIKAKLSQIEQRENIRILYACENGSRAWGFAASDALINKNMEAYKKLVK